MSIIDRWPSTPYKQFTGWCAFVAFFLFSLAVLWANKDVRMELWYGLAGLVALYNGDGTAQYFFKRKTYLPDPPTVTAEAGSTVNVEAPAIAAPLQPQPVPPTARDD